MNKKENKHRPCFSAERFYRHPGIMLIVIVSITLFFALQLIRIRFDNNNFRFIPKNDPARISAEKIAETFGDEVPILIGIKRQYSDIVDKDFLNAVRKLDADIKGLGSLIKNTVLITNTKHIESDGGGIKSEPLISGDFSGSREEVNEVKRKLRSWNLYSKSLVSDDLRATQILVFLGIKNEESGSPETIAVCRKIMALADKWNFPDSQIYLTGAPVFNEIVNEATAHDLAFLIPIVIAAVIAVLFFSFGRFSGVFLPLLTVLVSAVWALGAMSLFGVPLSILSTILPVILIAVGSAYGIHIINHYYDEVTQNDRITKEEHKKQIVKAVREVMRPVFLAAITTFAGFFSFCFTLVVPIFEFGIFSGFGVLAAFLISITLIPSILILRGPKNPSIRWTRKTDDEKAGNLDKGIATTFVLIANHSRSVVLAAGVLIVFSVFGIKRLVIDNVLTEYFEKDVPVVQADIFMREEFGGSKLLNMIVKTEDESSVLRPDILKAVDGLSEYLETKVPEAGKVTSIVPLIKRMNRVFNANEPPEGISVSALDQVPKMADAFDTDDFGNFGEEETGEAAAEPLHTERSYSQKEIIEMLHKVSAERGEAHIFGEELVAEFEKKINYAGAAYDEIPFDPAKYGKTDREELIGIIENYVSFLGENADGFLDNKAAPSALKINIQLKTTGQNDSDIVLNKINNFVQFKFPDDVKIETGGSVLIEKSLNNLVVKSQLISVGVSLIIVFLILSVYYRSAAAGIIGAIPLSISILLNFGIMGFLGIKLNIGTALVASFAIGIGVDYTIHFLAAYHKHILRSGSNDSFLYNAFLSSGKAILFNAVSVGAGFSVLMFSKFNMLSELGFLIAMIMITSSLGSLTILPTILNLLKPKFIKKVLFVDKHTDSENIF